MKYDFDKIVDRHGTDCYKWDMIAKRKLPADTLPLWVADMDFETVPEVKERLKEVADRGIYGYSMLGDGYYHALKNWFSERFGWQVGKRLGDRHSGCGICAGSSSPCLHKRGGQRYDPAPGLSSLY